MLSLSGRLWCSFGRPWRRRPVGRGATIAVRSLRSGLPRCQPRTPSAPYGFPRAHLHAPHPTGRRRHGLRRDHFTGAGANRVLGVLAADRVGTEDLAGPPKPAARAAFFGIWGEVGRDAEESERQRRRYYVWKSPGCIGRSSRGRIRDASGVLPVEGSAMHRQTSSLSAVLPQYQARAKPVTRKPPSIARRHSLPLPTGRPPKQATRHPRTASSSQAKTPRKLRAAARAQRHQAKPRHRVSCGRPPARPPATGISNLVKCPRSCSATGQEKRSSSGRRPGRRATSMRPTESEGSRRQAATRMRQGKSGANAPDRNRGRPPPGPPARRAA
ncbi:hypothetical protein LMG26842_05222 [Achromobacter dolens]|nr:hypothetical protein LMG26842_05222 [Achromobacter dolens]